MKRLLAFLLAVVMLFALCSCKGGNSGGSADANIPEGKQIPDDAVLNVTIASHASWPYEEGWAVWKYIKEAIGGTVNVTAVPSSDFATKFPLIMATPDSFPDVIGFQGSPSGFSDYCSQGAFISLDDYADLLPDYNKFWDSLDEDGQYLRNIRKSADGKIYYAPIYGMDRQTNVRAWLYRKDIFEKNNLKAPETMDELYEVCKKLKEKYPDSYPFSIRSGLSNINVIAASWKPGFMYNAYYDFENEKWSYGATESETMLEIVKFLNKMVSEKLAPADFFTINATSWQELVTTDRGFIMPEYQTRIDFFNSIARANNPNFNLTAMTPPKGNTATAAHMVNKWNNDPMGFGVLNTGDKARIANAMRYVNWFYSDEGCNTISWGKEGETYEVKDGKKQFILKDGEVAKTKYGFQTIGTYLRVDPEAADASSSAEQVATTDFVLEHTYDKLNPTQWLQFTDEESKLLADYDTSIRTFVEENLMKFVIGQRPLSEWDNFQKELGKLPIDDLLSIYETAYNRVK